MSSIFGNRPLRVRLDGAPLDSALARYAVSAFVRQALNAPALAELAFADPPTDALSDLALGVTLAIAVDGAGDRHRHRPRRAHETVTICLLRMATLFSSVNSSKPASPISRPTPLAL